MFQEFVIFLSPIKKLLICWSLKSSERLDHIILADISDFLHVMVPLVPQKYLSLKFENAIFSKTKNFERIAESLTGSGPEFLVVCIIY